MAQFEDMKNLDLYDDDTIAVAQKGFKKDICTNRNNDSHCADAGPDENEKTLTTIIEKEDDDINSTSDAEQNVYIFPVREVNCEADSLNEMKDLEINTELYNDHDGEQFVKNSASIMDVEIEIEIDTCGDEKDIAFNSQSNVCGKSRKRSKCSHYFDTCTPPKQMARERKKKPKPLDNHDNLHSDSKMAKRKKKRPKVYNDRERSQLRMVEKFKKRPKLFEKCNNSQSKLIERKRMRSRTESKTAGKKRKRPSTGEKLMFPRLTKDSVVLFLILYHATSIHGMETSKCKDHGTPVFNISASSYKNPESCESELDQFGCKTDHIRACISDWKGQIWAVCTEDLCLQDDACPVLTNVKDQKMSLVVQSIDEEKCGNCSDSLKKRLQRGQNCHKNFYRTTTMAAPSTINETINRTTVAISSLDDSGSGSGFEAGVVVAVVIILIIVVVVVVGVVFYKKNLFGFKDSVQQHITDICRRIRFQQNNNTEGQDVEKGEEGEAEEAQPMIQHGNGDTELEPHNLTILGNGSLSVKFTASGEEN